MRERVVRSRESTAAPKLLSQAAYARRKKVTQNAVYAAVRAGRIQLVDGLVDPVQADRAWNANTDAARQTRNGNGHGPAYGTYSESRARREDAQAELVQLELEEKRGRLVDATEVEKRFFDRARLARNTLLAIPARLGRMLAGISDPDECERRLRLELELVCAKLAGKR